MSDNNTSDYNVPTVSETNDLAMQLHTALRHIEQGYSERIAALADEIHKLDAQIEQIEKDIALLEKEKAPQEEHIERLDREIESEMKFIEKLSEQLIKKAEVTAELKQELDTLPSSESSHMLQNRKMILNELKKEIEETEILLMQKELDRQNSLIEIEPIRQQIKSLQVQKNALKAQKRYAESSGMHKLTQPALPTRSQTDTHPQEVIDTDVD